MVADRRATLLRNLLGHARDKLALDVAFVLWDGSTVPDESSSFRPGNLLCRRGAIASLLRRPNIDTLLNLWVTSRVDCATARFSTWPGGGRRFAPGILFATRQAAGVEDRACLSAGACRRPAAARSFERDGVRRDGSPSTNKQNISHHYDVSNKFYSHVPRSGDGLQLRLLHRLGQRSRHRAARQARHDLPQAAAASRARACSTSAAAGAP